MRRRRKLVLGNKENGRILLRNPTTNDDLESNGSFAHSQANAAWDGKKNALAEEHGDMTLRAHRKNHSTIERLIRPKKDDHGNMSLGAHCENHSLERLIRSKKGVNGMRIKPNRQQATVCQTCGAKGYSELLLFCINCQISAVHWYCLHEIPENNEAEVSWVCEQCMQRACSLCSCHCADSKASGISASASHPLKNGSEHGGRGLSRGISYSTEIVNSSPVIEMNKGGKKTKLCLEILLSCDRKDAESLRSACIHEGENPFNSMQVGKKKDGPDHDIGRKCPSEYQVSLKVPFDANALNSLIRQSACCIT